jgi:2'-5' RNA ligase
LANDLSEVANAAAERFGDRPTRRETLHLTLAFLGDVAETSLPDIIAAGHRVVAAPFSLSVNRIGYWPHKRLLWAGCAPLAGLDQLHGKLQVALAEAGQAPPGRQASFTPHLTLVRKLPADTPAEAVSCFPLGDLTEWRCASFCLVQSRLTASGSRYETLAEFPLTV